MEHFFDNLKDNTVLNNLIKIGVKIFNSPILFSFSLLALVLLISFCFCHPYYQTCDDWIMRSIIDGSYGETGKPHAYVMWQNIIYTKFLQQLYIKIPQIAWYDLFTYVFMSISLLTTTMCLYSKNGKHKDIFNLFLFLTSFCVFTPIFIYTQFSIVAGCLTIAGITIGYYIATNKLSIIKNISYSILMILLLLQSSLIRFEVTCILLPLAFFVGLLLFKKEFFKKYILVGFCICFALVLCENFQIIHKNIVNNTPEYKKVYETHMARLNISERTSIYQDKKVVFYPWKHIENGINLNEKLKTISWNKGTYRLSLAWLDWGDVNLFNVKKMQEVKSILSDELSLKTHFNFSFEVTDWWNILKYYFLIIGFLACIFPSKKGATKIVFLLIAYFLFILASNNLFKVFPPRVWMNILNLLVLSSFLIIKNNFNSFYINNKIDKLVNKYNLSKFLTIKHCRIFLLLLAMIVFVGYSSAPTRKISELTNANYQAYKSSLEFLPKLDKTKIYIIDIFMQEFYSVPFGENILKKDLKIFPMAAAFFNESKELLHKYNIPVTETIRNFVERDDIYYYTHSYIPYGNFNITKNKLALASFMKETYNEEIAFIPVEKDLIDNIVVYDIIVLTPQQILRKNQIKKEQYFLDIYNLEKESKE